MQQDKIIKYIISQCPFGELEQLLIDLQTVYQDFQVECFENEIKQHYEKHLYLIKDQQDTIIISKDLQQNDGYLDPRQNTINQIDFLAQKISNQETSQNQISQEYIDFQEKLQKQLFLYKKEHLNNDNSQVLVKVHEDGVYICLSSKYLNYKNFCTGEWNSEWYLKDVELSGKVNINTHYYEEGNVQLNQEKSFNITLNTQKDLIQQIVENIRNGHNEIQNGLDELYQNITQTTLKVIRRTLPITNTKMDWNLHTHKMIQNLKQN